MSSVTVSAIASDSVSGVDPSSWKYRVDDGDWNEDGTADPSIVLNTEGYHVVTFGVKDLFGNYSEKTVEVGLDNTGPAISTQDVPWTNAESVVVTASAEDALTQVDENSWRFSKDEEGFDDQSAAYKTVTISDEGVHTVDFVVYDIVGNSSDEERSTVHIDRSGPVITAPEGSWSSSTSATVSASAEDVFAGGVAGSGVDGDSWQYRVDGGTWSATGSGNATANIAGAGDHSVTFRVKDVLGNASEKTVAVRMDPEGPVIVLPETIWTNTGTVTASASDALSGVDGASWEYRVDGGDWSGSGAGNDSVSLGAEGTYEVSFRVRDVAGNGSEKAATVHVDRTAPEITTADIPWTNAASVAASAVATDGFAGVDEASWRYSLDGGSWSEAGSANKSVAVTAEGTHTVSFRVSDGAGNTAEKSATVRIDRTGPVITASDVAWTQTAVAAAWAADSLSGMEGAAWKFRIDDGAWSDEWSESGTATVSEEGSHTVTFRARDIAGNISEKAVTVRVDATPPSISAADLPWTAAETALVSANATDALSAVNSSTWRYRIDEGTWSAGSNENSVVTLSAEGDHLVTFRVDDFAGNAAEKTVHVRLDHSGPAIVADDVPWTNTATVISAATASDPHSGVDPASWRQKIDGGEWSPAGSENDRVELAAEGVHTVSFRVNDAVGNESERTVTVRIDHTPPVISASGSPWSAAENVTVSASATDEPSGVDEASWRYGIDGGPWSAASNANKSVTVSAEGTHTVTFRMTDKAGNGAEKTVTVRLDRTGPTIANGTESGGNIFIRSGDEAYPAERYLETTTPTLHIVRSLSDGTDDASPVDKYEYAVQRNKAGTLQAPFSGTRYAIDVPTENEADESYDYQFPAGLFVDGTNYLYVRAVDAVGNAGTPIERVVRIDTAVPSAAAVKSSTHPAADDPSDAVSESTAVFSLSATTAGPLGIAGYEWELRVADATGIGTPLVVDGEAMAGRVSIPRLELYNLSDNEAEAFYVLRVRAIGGNGRAGAYGTYRFRVDTSPPTELRLVIRPQVQSDEWYGDATTKLSWRRPRDLTGIRSYKYRLSSAPIDIPQDAEADYFAGAEWRTYPTPDDETSSVSISLSSIIPAGGARTGTAYAAVACEDTAGNVEWDAAQFRYDLEAPSVAGVDASVDGDAVIGTLGSASDEEGSGVASRELRLVQYAKDEAGAWFTVERTSYAALQEGESSASFSGLEEGAYAVQARIVDAAGNAKIVSSAAVAIGGVELPQKVDRSFEIVANSFVVRGNGELDIAAGTWTFDPARIELVLPAAYPMNALGQDGTWNAAESLVPVAVTGGSPEELSLAFSGTYRFSMDDFDLLGVNPSFDAGPGFSWGSVSYVPLGAASLSYGATDYSIAMGLPPDESFAGCAELPHGASFTTSAKSAASETQPLWLLSGIDGRTTSLFSGTYWQLRNSRIQDTLSGSGGFYKRNAIELSTAQLDGRPVLVGGIVAENTTVTIGGVAYVLEESYIEGPYLKVKRAYIPLAADAPFVDDDRRISLRNILIGVDGTVTPASDFWSENIRYELALPDGSTVVVEAGENSLRFVPGASEGSVVVLDGLLTVPGVEGAMPISGLSFNAEGVVLDGSATIANFSGLVHGYTVTSEDASLVAEGIELGSAEMQLSPYTELSVTLDKLVLSYDGYGQAGYAVKRAGTWSVGNASALMLGAPYGAGIGARSLEVSAAGVSASIEVVLPAVLGGEATVFTEVPLPKSGAYGRSATLAALSVTPSGFDGALNGAYFNGTTVGAESLDVTVVGGDDGIAVNFPLPSVAAEGWATAANPTTTLETRYAYGDWRFALSSFTLNGDGIACTDARLLLPEAVGAYELACEGAEFTSPGVFVPGALAASSYALIGGWLVDLEGAAIAEDGTLLDGQAVVTLHASMGEGAFLFPDLALTSSGSVATCGLGSAELPFIAENSFGVVAKDYRIGDDGITSGGKIYFPSAFGDDVFASYNAGEIAVNADGSVQTERKDTDPVPFHFGALSLSAEGYWFSREGLTAAALTATVNIGGNEVGFALPETSFYSDGTIRSGGKLVEGFQKELFGFTFTVVETRLVDDGLRLKSYVRLPEVLDSHEIYFDALTLHPDGSVTTDVALDRFRLSRGGLGFDLSDIRFEGSAGISIGEAIVTLPEPLESKTIRMTNLSVSADGDFSLGGMTADPVELWGFTFYFDSLSIEDGNVDFDGAVCLPTTFPSAIAGKTVDISEFRYSLSTEEVVSFKIGIEEALTFPIVGDWVVTARGVSVAKRDDRYFLSVDEGTLDFPPAFFGDDLQPASAEISGLTLDPQDGSFSFDSVTISDVGFTKFGCDFTLSSLSVSGDFDFRFAGNVVLPSNNAALPPFLSGKTIEVSEFEIHSDGSLGNIDGSISGLTGIALGSLLVEDCSVGFTKTGDDYYLSASAGTVRLGSSFPAGIAGAELAIEALKVKLNDFSIETFSARLLGAQFDLFGQARVENADLGIVKQGSDFALSVSNAQVVLTGAAFPASLRNERLVLSDFRMDTAGRILGFAAGLSISERRALFSDVYFAPLTVGTSAHVGAALNAEKTAVIFSLSGGLEFGSSFPSQIAGSKASITTLQFDTSGSLLAVDAAASLPDMPLFGTLTLRGGSVGLEKQGSTDLGISVSGRLALPASAPEGLGGKELTVSSFKFGTDGSVKEIAASLEGLTAADRVTMFGGLRLQTWTISIAGRSGNDLALSVSGEVVLPSTLPGALKGTRLVISEFTFSSASMAITRFDATLRPGSGGLSFPIFAGINAELSTLHIATDGFSMSGSMTMPSTFPLGLAGMTVTLDSLAMGWDGTVKALQAGIAAVDVNLLGFPVALRSLSFGTEGIAMASATLSLPSSLGGKQFGLRDARFDTSGQFSAAFVLPKLEVGISGFSLVLEAPSLDFARQAIRCDEAYLVTPSIMPLKNISLSGLSIGAEGIRFTGGGARFSLPKFGTQGGLEFSLTGELHLNTSGKYYISAAGSAFLPGAGTVRAEASFVNASSTYPIGLQYAKFQYTVSGLGLPIMGTGLFMNSISGSLGFGYPAEIPAEVRNYFTEGIRIGLGVGVQDATYGAILKGGADLWIDVVNWDWAFQGNMTVLSGLAKTDMIVSLAGGVFHTSFHFRVFIVDGKVQIWIWEERGDPKLSGRAEAKFVIEKGFIIHWHWGPFSLHVPPWDITLPGGVGVEFGQFKGGKVGVKGWIDVPILGDIGIFVSRSGGIDITHIDEYELYIPTGRSRIASSMRASLEDTAAPRISFRGETVSTSTEYLFRVPEARGMGSATASLRAAQRGLPPLLRADTVADDDLPQSAAERLIFSLSYTEGDPRLVATAPSGKVYEEGNPDVFVQRTEDGLLMAVLSSEAGEWSTRVENLSDGLQYVLKVFGKAPKPEIEVWSPDAADESADGAYTVEGSVAATGATAVEVYLSTEADSYAGRLLGMVVADADGRFSLPVDLSQYPEGTYYVYASLDDEDGVASAKSYAPGSLVVAHTTPLAAPLKPRVGEEGDGMVTVSIEDTNGRRSAGYVLYLETDGEETERKDIGALANFSLPGLTAGKEYRISAAAYDADRAESARSEAAAITIGAEKERHNEFTLAAEAMSLSLTSGSQAAASVAYTVATPVYRGDAFDRMMARVVSGPEWLSVRTSPGGYDLSTGTGSAEFTIGSNGDPAAGSYEAVLAFENMGNREIAHSLALTINVAYPAPAVETVRPDEMYSARPEEILVGGAGFIDGTKIELDGVEVEGASVSPNVIRFTPPEGLSGGAHAITVKSPGGRAASSIEVLAPYYTLTFAASRSEVVAGEACSFPYSVTGMNEFIGNATISTLDVPEGWNVTFSPLAVPTGSSGTIEIRTPSGAAAESTTLFFKTDQGDTFSLQVAVTAAPPAPTIVSLRPSSAIAGETVTVHGYGFGSSGAIFLNGKDVASSSWNNHVVTFVVPADAASGPLAVESGGVRSAEFAFVVMNEGFSLYPDADTLTLQPGESATISCSVAGAKRLVSLTPISEDPALSAVLSSQAVLPNGRTLLTVTAAEDASAGVRTVSIRGSAGTVLRQSDIQVSIGNVFEVTTASLPSAMELGAYRTELTSVNGTEPLSWSLAEGVLPSGLNLRATGVISGTPTELGLKSFTVRATDGRGRTADKKLSIAVEENAWAQPGKDGGRSGYNATAVPAEASLAWTSDETAALASDRLITGGKRVFAYGSGGLTAFDNKTGHAVYRLAGPIPYAAYASETLFTLDSDGILTARDAAYGYERWKLENVKAFALDGATLYASDGTETRSYQGTGSDELVAGSPLADFADGFADGDAVFFAKGIMHRVRGNALEALEADGWRSKYLSSSELKTGLWDGTDFLVATDSVVLALDEAYGLITGYAAEGGTGTILASAAEIVAETSSGASIIDRRTGVARAVTDIRGRYALGAEKLLASTSAELSVLNVYRGTEIWSAAPSVDSVAASGRVYSLGTDRKVRCYAALENIAPPETVIALTPGEPDGAAGWYATRPTMTLRATDLETYAAWTKYRFADGEWKSYGEPVVLGEGEYPIAAASADSHGYAESEKSLNVKVDATVPVALHEATITAGNPGWSLSAATLAILATDETSGVEAIEYRYNGGDWKSYYSPLSFGEEGAHSVEYRARDRAGHLSGIGAWAVSIDLFDPETEATAYTEAGLGVVYLSAQDGESGVARIEYRADGGEVAVYRDPVALLGGGTHGVEYRAVDAAGRASVWKTISVVVPQYQTGKLILDLRFPGYMGGRKIIKNAQVGMPLYGQDNDRENKIDALPEYVLGSDQIRLSEGDRWNQDRTLGSFTAGDDVTVYYFKHALSQANMNGWTLAAQKYPVENQKYFIGGASIYERRYAQGDRVLIPGPATNWKGYAPLIFVQKSAAETVRVTSPAVGSELAPLDEVRLAGTTLGGAIEGTRFRWSASFLEEPNGSEGGDRHGDGNHAAWPKPHDPDPISLPVTGDGEAFGGAVVLLPYAEGKGTLSVTLELVDSAGTLIGKNLKTYAVVNKAEMELYEPAPGIRLARDRNYALKAEAKDLRGAKIDPSRILWASSRDGKTWASAPVSSGTLKAPSSSGDLYLRARWPEGAPADGGTAPERERIWRFTVGTEEIPIAISFGGARSGMETSGGEPFGTRGSGKEYGFTVDHGDRVRSFRAVRIPKGKSWDADRTETYVALAAGEKFLVKAGVGRIKARLLLGPYGLKGSYDVRVEGSSARIDKKRGDEEVWEVELETTCADGLLEIAGSADMPLIEVALERLDEGEAKVETTVTPRSDIRVLAHDKPWEWNKPWVDPRGPGPYDWDRNEWGICNSEWDY